MCVAMQNFAAFKALRIATALTFFSILTFFVLHIPATASAVSENDLSISTSCAVGEAASFTALVNVPEDSYNVYVKLAKRGQTATVQFNTQTFDELERCSRVGEVRASGDTWTKIGSMNVSEQTDIIFQLTSLGLGAQLDANRPSVMIIPTANPLCVPSNRCEVEVGGQTGYVLPPGNLTNIDSLRVVRVTDPSTDQIERVVYYVDEKPAYITKQLEDFDLRYVTFVNQDLARVIEYESGQRIVLEQTPPRYHADNIGNFLFRIVQTNPQLLQAIAWAVGIALAIGIVSGIYHTVQRHREWRISHGFLHERVRNFTDADRRKAFLRDHTMTIVKHIVQVTLIVAGVLAFVVLISMFAFSTFRVDGTSMELTLKNGSIVGINKIPVTAGNISGKDFVPNRGDIVVTKAVYGIVESNNVFNEDSYVVKRVIGLPGERITLTNGLITIYNTEYPDGFNPDEGSEWAETMQQSTARESIDLTLGQNELFITGDNRLSSIDSRFNGPITTTQVVGVVVWTIWSPNTESVEDTLME